MSVDTRREAHHINRVRPADIQDFLTAQTYRPEVVKAKEKVQSLTWKPLQSVCKHPIRQGKSPTYCEGGELICIKPKHTNEMIVSLEGADFIDPATLSNVAGQRLEPGDIVITRSGSGTIGRASLFLSDVEVYTNDHLFIVRTDQADSYFTCAFLGSYWGQRLLEAGISGSTGQLNLSNEHIKSLPLYLPDAAAQRYIGDKVRQAERLQAWSKQTEELIAKEFASLVSTPLSPQQYWRASPTDLDPYRINPKQYDPVVLDLIKRAREEGHELQLLGELFGQRQMSGGATPKGAEYFNDGIFFARVQNVKPLRLDLSDAAYIDKEADRELARSRCAADDIILSITGYPGTAALVTEDDLPVNINQHSVRFDVKADVYPGFVCAALNSRFLKYQVDRLAIGGTRDALDYPSVSRLLIPRFSADIEKAIDESVRDFVAAIKYAQRLTLAAKLLVEALIEGRVSEVALTSAQHGIDVGNDQADLAILQRIKVDGVDGEGAPLFPDLDKLCELLAQVQD